MRKQIAFALSALGMAATSAAAQTAPTPPRTFPYGSAGMSPSMYRPDAVRNVRQSASYEFATSLAYAITYQHVLDYGRCAINVSNGASKRLLATDRDTLGERGEARQLVLMSKPCRPYGYGAPVAFFRAGIAEALYKKTANNLDPASRREIQAFLADEATRDRSRQVDDGRFVAVANCIVVNAPDQVRSFLSTSPGSKLESDAVSKVFAMAPTCGTRRNLPSTGGTTFLRAYVAEAAYRFAAMRSKFSGS